MYWAFGVAAVPTVMKLEPVGAWYWLYKVVGWPLTLEALNTVGVVQSNFGWLAELLTRTVSLSDAWV